MLGLNLLGGEGGIRTLGRLSTTHDFQSCTIGHSVTSPRRLFALAHFVAVSNYTHFGSLVKKCDSARSHRSGGLQIRRGEALLYSD